MTRRALSPGRAILYVLVSTLVIFLSASLVARAGADGPEAPPATDAIDLFEAVPGARLESGTGRIMGRLHGETIVLAVGIPRAFVGEREVALPDPPRRIGGRILISSESLRLIEGDRGDEEDGEGAVIFPVLPEETAAGSASVPPRDLTGGGRLPRSPPRSWKVVRSIVLDPGHGGQDAGAVGRGGLKEKDVVLDIGRRVAELLRANGGQQAVHMTRSEDVFIPLPGRVEIAREKDADLFVSIHINSTPRRRRPSTATGSEVYYFSNPSDEDAERVARQEGEFHVEDISMNPVLFDLLLQGNVIESSALARAVESRLPGALGIPERGVKTARFYVLHYGVVSNIPSILIEVAYISNPAEEAKLRTDEFRARAAESIAESLLLFSRDLETRYPGGRGWRR